MIDDIAYETGIAFLNMAAFQIGEMALAGAEETGLISAETATMVTGSVGGLVTFVGGANALVNKAHSGFKRASATASTAVDTISNFVTPDTTKPDDKIGGMTSKRQKKAATRQVARNINFNDAEMSTGIRRSINVQDPVTQVFRHADDQPVSNMPAAMQVGNDGEVPVAKVPRLISKIHPDVFNIRLPFYKSYPITNTWIARTNSRPLGIIRLNSIYDIFKNTQNQLDYPVNPFQAVTDAATTAGIANAPVGSAATVAAPPRFNDNIGPVGRNVWQGHFKYYRVLRSDVKLTFVNVNCNRSGSTGTLLSNPGGSVGALHNFYAIGYELVDEDGKLCEDLTSFMTAKGVVRDVLMPAIGGDRIQYATTPDALSFFTCAKPAVGVMQYTYKPENWNQHVEQKGQETRWTAIGANPALDHLLAIRAFHMDTVNQSFDYNGMEVIVQIEFEVQFRECLDAFIKEGFQGTAVDT